MLDSRTGEFVDAVTEEPKHPHKTYFQANREKFTFKRPMIITQEFIFQHRTMNGGWTSSQFKALGLDWKDKIPGWIDSMVGKEITDEQAAAFIAGATQYKKRTNAVVYFYNKLRQAAALANLTPEQSEDLAKMSTDDLATIFKVNPDQSGQSSLE